jgi:membrane protein YqaA with SNARE-associated domain
MIAQTKKLIRYVYDKMLYLSAHEKALYFLFVISFFESSFFPIPPDVMIIPMVLAAPHKAYRIALVAMIASVLGGYFGYAIGMFAFDLLAEPILKFYGYMDKFEEFREFYHQHDIWVVFIGGITPFPYKVITITSGMMHLDLVVFGIASVFARGIRFYFLAWLLKKYGAPIKVFIERHLGLLSIIFVILLLGGFYLIKYI